MSLHRLQSWGRSIAAQRIDSRASQSDAGFSLIEVLVAVVLLIIVSLPALGVVIESGSSASQSRLDFEASNVAETQIENLQNLSSFGNIPSGLQVLPSVTIVENGGTQSETFGVTAQYTLQADTTYGGSSVCTLASGTAIPPEIWDVSVVVSWGNPKATDSGSVTEGTYLAPEAGGSIPATSGELAVQVENSLGTPYTAGAVPISVVGSWNGVGSQPTPPANQTTSAEGNTGTSGCAVFPGLDPAAGWQYEVCIGSSTTCPTTAGSSYTSVVSQQELPGIINTSVATAATFSEGPVNLAYGTATLASPIEVDPGANVPLSFVTQPCAGCSTLPPPAADLPLTVEAAQLTGANNTFVFDTNAALQISAITLFPQSDYECWAGDTPDSSPTYAIGTTAVYAGATVTSCDTTTTSPSVSLPVYATVLKATWSAPISAPTVTATEFLAPYETVSLNALSPSTSPGTTSTGLPLGQYQLGYKVAGVNALLSKWIWVTPAGVYSSATAYTAAPTGTPSSPGTAIAVTL